MELQQIFSVFQLKMKIISKKNSEAEWSLLKAGPNWKYSFTEREVWAFFFNNCLYSSPSAGQWQNLCRTSAKRAGWSSEQENWASCASCCLKKVRWIQLQFSSHWHIVNLHCTQQFHIVCFFSPLSSLLNCGNVSLCRLNSCCPTVGTCLCCPRPTSSWCSWSRWQGEPSHCHHLQCKLRLRQRHFFFN